ncbi:unnamed protein product, partial [Phaeothamnion confervicola]
LSRGQRKRAIAKQKLITKKQVVETIKLQRLARAAPKRGLDGVSSGGLLESLQEVAATAGAAAAAAVASDPSGATGGKKAAKVPPFQKLRRNSGKRMVAAMELEQLSAVLTHDSFQASPFEAIQAHL